MCDYSLFAHPNRLASEGEQLVVHRFSSTAIGLASPIDITARNAAQNAAVPEKWFSWAGIRKWLTAPEPEPSVPAVCIPPGSQLMLRDVGRDLQKEFRIASEETVTFVELSVEAHRYRDAVRFSNGKELLLQRLREGQRVDVLCLAAGESPAEVLARMEI